MSALRAKHGNPQILLIYIQDSGMKTLIALDDQEELIDKFEGAMDGINSDMALAEKALKVGFCID